MEDFIEISADELTQVGGGAHQTSSGGLFGFFDSIYKNIVFSFGGKVGGTKLAEKMYGKHVTDRDKQRSQEAMKQFLVAGHKLPKGVPNLFG
jgi:hypothetical protein